MSVFKFTYDFTKQDYTTDTKIKIVDPPEGDSSGKYEIRVERVSYYSVPVHCIKSILEEFEKLLRFKNLKEEVMIEKLQNDGYDKEWLAQHLNNYDIKQDNALKHFIKWFYILNYNNYEFWPEYKEAFEEENVSLVQFGAFAACICSIPTDGTHHLPIKHMKFVDLKDSLKKYEIENEQLLDCLGLLDKIRYLRSFIVQYKLSSYNNY